MKKITILFSVYTMLILSACSSLHKPPQQTYNKSNGVLSLCVYKTEKGIAEVISIGENSYRFTFYLGDDIFFIDKELAEIYGKLKIGDELKAVKKIMINGDKRQDCPALEFHLIH